MENKINIAEILKDCPKGMELYSPLCGDCKLYDVNDYNIRIEASNKDTLICLYHDGRYCANGEIMLFPKGKTTWEGFVPPCGFKDGDIYYIKDVFGLEFVSIIKKCENDKLYTYVDISISNNNFYCEASEGLCYCKDIIEHRLATEEEKAKLFDAIKADGYKWNAETKNLEKLVKPKFKVGDIIRDITGICKVKITKVNVEDEYYLYKSLNINGLGSITFNGQDNWELVPDKFDVINFEPFMKVLVRSDNSNIWECDFFSSYNPKCSNRFHCIGAWYNICIPYIGNEHLLGTTDDCDEFYKNW